MLFVELGEGWRFQVEHGVPSNDGSEGSSRLGDGG